MKLNLRKASALQMAINDQIASVDMPGVVTINRYDFPMDAVEKASVKFTDGLTKKMELFDVLYSIRQKTATASEQAGVSKLLAEAAHIDKLIHLLTPLAGTHEFKKTPEKLTEAFEDLRKEASAPVQYAHQRREFFDTSVVTETQVAEWKKQIADFKRGKQGLSDALLEANVMNEIDLSDQQVSVLKKYGIL